ncbi:hypothetical protein [Niallia endozanthoxylica]|uniref:Uncharacterized protein n=1 Tax=Niallia endozanthoxylica TaxID=2036016 RepID=A0A5J5I3L9_9BACI|nr:hypothetical protein [Niallia endozanthoxylica]KAA9030671.1 hypothetical protein F4V44_02460 [Niallia endozanthoxylica]
MKKLTKGAFAMVLAGAVTFSITNALLVQESPKRGLKEKDIAISEVPKQSDVTNQDEKPSKDQLSISIVKDVETKPSLHPAAVQVAENNRNMSETKTIAANNQNTEGVIKTTATTSEHSTVATAAPPSGTSSKGSTPTSTSTTPRTNSPSEPAPTSTPTSEEQAPMPTTTPASNEPAPTTTPAAPETTAPSEPVPVAATKPNAPEANPAAAGNYGQQVSQAVKEENQVKKANKGKDM